MYLALLSATALTFSLTAGTAHAYLSPSDVFTDLEIPEMTEGQPSPAQQEPAAQEQPASQAYPSQEPAAAEAPTQSAPAFFRSGEKIEKRTIPEVDTTSSTESPFEEGPGVNEILIPTLPTVETVDEQSEALLEETQQDEDVLEEETENVQEEEPEEATQAAAPKKKSVAMALFGKMKYLGGGVILAAIAFVFFFKKKRSTGPAKQTAMEKQPNIPAPENPQKVEESSQRLEHALEAMGQKPAAPANEESADDSVGFSETPLPGQEEKLQ
jgi:hypothetical protein